MPRKELHSDDLPQVEQRAPIPDNATEYEGDVILTDKLPSTGYADDLAFMDEPVVIRLEPSSDKNAANVFPVWVNGQGAQVLMNGAWREITYLPVGQVLTVKRKVLEVIIRAKVDTVTTVIREMDAERPNNVIQRFTSAVMSFSVIEDRNPRGAGWIQEQRRRNL